MIAAGAHALAERLPFEQFHRDEVLVLPLLDRVDRADVRMVQGGRCARFSLKPFERLRIRRQRRREELQRDMSAELCIFRFVNDAHAAAAERADDAVMRNESTDHGENGLYRARPQPACVRGAVC